MDLGSFPTRHPKLRLTFGPDGNFLGAVQGRGRGLLLSPQSLELLRLCDGTHDRAALADAVSWEGPSPAAQAVIVEATLARLAEAGLVIAAEAAAAEPDEGAYSKDYAHPATHRVFVGDAVRTDAYRRAIAASVRPGDVVVEVGAGTGILSVLAAQAGAAVVHAVEPTALAAVIPAVAAANGVGDRVVVHRADATTVELDVDADLLIADWVGSLVVTERIFPAAARLRDRCLKANGRLLPSDVTLYLAPACDPAARAAGPELWATRPAGVDLSPVREREYARLQTARRTVAPAALLAPSTPVHRFDCRTLTPERARTLAPATVAFTIERDDVLDGLCAHFVSQLAPDVALDTSPAAPATFYRQHWLPLPPQEVRAGEQLTIALAIAEDSAGGQEVHLTVERGGTRTEHRYEPG